MFNVVIILAIFLCVVAMVFLHSRYIRLLRRVESLESLRLITNSSIGSLLDKQMETSKALESVMQQQRRQAKTRYEPTRNNNDRSQVRTRQRK